MTTIRVVADRVSSKEFADAVKTMPDLGLLDDERGASVFLGCDQVILRLAGGNVVVRVPDHVADNQESVEALVALMAYLARRVGGELLRDGRRLDPAKWISPYWTEIERAAASKPDEPPRERVPYSPGTVLRVGDRLCHAKFGEGSVERVMGKHVQVRFSDGVTRKLAHGGADTEKPQP